MTRPDWSTATAFDRVLRYLRRQPYEFSAASLAWRLKTPRRTVNRALRVGLAVGAVYCVTSGCYADAHRPFYGAVRA